MGSERRIPAPLANVTEENDENMISIRLPQITPSTRAHIEDTEKAVRFKSKLSVDYSSEIRTNFRTPKITESNNSISHPKSATRANFALKLQPLHHHKVRTNESRHTTIQPQPQLHSQTEKPEKRHKKNLKSNS